MGQLTFYASTDVEVTGITRVFGIIGDPVSHSLSPLFQARFAAQHDLDVVYIPLRVAQAEVEAALAGLWASNIQGLNVTVPHKETVSTIVEKDAAARLIGAVNTVRRSTDGWYGTNTDWQGARDALQYLGAQLAGADVLLIGAGGTARAVLHALAEGKARRIYISNRSPERLSVFMGHAAGAYPEMEVSEVAWEKKAIEACALHCPVIINTTSIGLGGTDEVFPFAIGGEGVALDAVYTPDGRTPFVVAALKGGRRAIDGLPMLLAQGAASFEWWHDARVDLAPVMKWMEKRLGRCQADRSQ